MKSKQAFFPLFIVAVLVLSACAPQATPQPQATVDVNAIHTQVVQTISAEITAQALANPSATPQPSATSIPTETATLASIVPPTNTSVPTIPPPLVPPTATPNPQTAVGCYNAMLVADMTVPYGTIFKPGDKFTKTWRVKNTGSCNWEDDFKIAYVGGELFGSDTTKIRFRLGPNGVADISLDMIAPNMSGTVTSSWQMMTNDGKAFGQVMSVTIALPGGTTTPSEKTDCNATLVSISIQNGTQFRTDETFTQTFILSNNGKCRWTGSFKILFVGGDVLGSDTTKIRQNVDPGAVAEISLKMKAPSAVGEYTSSWQMLSDNGTLFGPVITFIIKVK